MEAAPSRQEAEASRLELRGQQVDSAGFTRVSASAAPRAARACRRRHDRVGELCRPPLGSRETPPGQEGHLHRLDHRFRRARLRRRRRRHARTLRRPPHPLRPHPRPCLVVQHAGLRHERRPRGGRRARTPLGPPSRRGGNRHRPLRAALGEGGANPRTSGQKPLPGIPAPQGQDRQGARRLPRPQAAVRGARLRLLLRGGLWGPRPPLRPRASSRSPVRRARRGHDHARRSRHRLRQLPRHDPQG